MHVDRDEVHRRRDAEVCERAHEIVARDVQALLHEPQHIEVMRALDILANGRRL